MYDATARDPLMGFYREWFDSYCGSFREPDPDSQRNFDLKEVHTHKVCEAARLIAGGGSPRRLLLAEIAALCHDLGRFPQYQRYRTFKDSDSVNHAHLSAQVMLEHRLLDRLPETERDTVLAAVRLHNVFRIPEGLSPETLDLLQIVRDADKLDIWRVFLEYYHAPAAEKASAAALGFADEPVCSREVLDTVSAGNVVQLKQLRTLNDFKLLQLSWIYDVNFCTTLALVRKRMLIEGVADTLPADEAVRSAVARVLRHLEEKLQSSSSLEKGGGAAYYCSEQSTQR